MKTLTTTFNRLRAAGACESGYKKLAKHLGGVGGYGANTPINLLAVLKSNGVQDMLWCLRATVEPVERLPALLAADFAESVLPIFEKKYPADLRPGKAIAAARSGGSADADAAYAAYAAAADAAAAAADAAAYAAAYVATYAATYDATYDAAYAAAYAAADAAAYAAAYAAADAAREAERAKQAKLIRSRLK